MAPRIRVRRREQQVALGLGALVGATLASQGLHPTGHAVLDWCLLVAAAAGAVWASATAPWWSLVVLAATGAALAPAVAALVLGLAVVALACAIGALKRSQPIERAVVAGAAILVLSVARELGAWGINALVAIAVTVAVAVLGAWRRPSRDRRIAAWVGGVAVGICVLGGAGLAVAGMSARGDLTSGNSAARQGLRLLKQGQFDAAREAFGQAAGRFERAGQALQAPWAQAARLVPVAAQHRHAGEGLSWSAADASRTIEEQLGRIDLDALRIVDGRIDVDAVRDLQAPMIAVQAALDELDAAVHDARSGWLAGPVQRRLDDLAHEIDEQRQLGEAANHALRVAPAMLGADRPRTYFVMFTTPAEARGQGGFMGNYAELTVTDGLIELTAFGRHTDLNAAGGRPRTLTEVPEDWLARYAQVGFQTGPDRVVGEQPWSLITMSPNFPATAQAVAELYPQSGGRQVDGVFSVDVYVMEALVGLVGPLQIPDAPQLTGDNTAEFLLLGQYLGLDDADFGTANAARQDMLETVALETVNRLLSTSPPDPIALGRALAPLADESRIYGWSRVPEEQALMTEIDLDGALLDDDALIGPDGVRRDGFMVAVNNAAGSKIDSFLERAYSYDAAAAELRLTFTNTAPASGLPNYVIGTGGPDIPLGTSLLWVSVFTTVPVDGAFVEGQPVAVHPTTEAGTFSTTVELQLASQEAKTIVVRLAESPHRLVEQVQPLTRDRPSTGSATP